MPSHILSEISAISKVFRTLITGGAGFIGSNLCRALLAAHHEVWAVDNLITGKLENIESLLDHKRFHFIEADITETAFTEQLGDGHFDYLYHLACPTGVPNIQPLAEEMLRTCALGTFHVMEIARQHQAKLLLSSSCEIYGQPQSFPQTEDYTGNVDPIGPRSAYEEGKRFAESVVAMYARKYNLEAKIVRFFNVYGPGMTPNDTRVIPNFLHHVQQQQKLVVYGDGQQTRTFLYIDDLIRGLLRVMEQGKAGEAYNIGSTEQTSIRSLATLVAKLTKQADAIIFSPHFIEDHRHREPSIKKIMSLGWKPEIALEEGLRLMVQATEAETTAAELVTAAPSGVYQQPAPLS